MEIKIFSWNCNGRLNKSITFLDNYLQYHIIHLSETKHNSYTNFKIPKNFTPVSNPGIRLGDTDRGGNIIFVKKSIYKRSTKTRYFEWGTILYFSDTVLVFVYFVPADSRYHRDESFTEFFSFLNNIMKSGKTVVIVGDHNGRFGKLEFTNRLYADNVDNFRNSQGDLLRSIYNECGFYTVNHLYSEGQVFQGDFTFIRGEKRSQVDFLFTNNHVNISHFHLANEGFELSDHKMITFSISMKMELPGSALLKWSKDSNIVGHNIIKNQFKVNFDVDTEKMKHVLHDNLVAFEDRLSTGQTQTENIIEDFNDTVQLSFLQCKINKQEKEPSNSWNGLSGKELWDKIDWCGKFSSTKDTNKPEKEDLFVHFKNLYSPQNEPAIETPTRDNEIYVPVTDDPITDREISTAFNQQKKGYNYSNSILRPFKEIFLPYMYTLMNIVFFASTEVIKWAPSTLFTIAKKGNLMLVKNWRGIQVAEYINSWYDRILCNRIKLWMDIDELQTAYQRGKSCNTQIFTFRTITELAKKKNKPLYISYVDLEKAFDKVRRSTMLNVLSKLGMGTVMLNAIKNLYSVTNVHFNGIGKFTTTSGIRQGASSSVYIFIIFINGLFKHLRSKFPESSIYGFIHNLIHADDTLVIDEHLETLKQKVVSTYDFFNDIDQSVNIGKSKYMCLDGRNRDKFYETMIINGQSVKYTKKEKYLGHYITDDNSLNTAILSDLQEREANVIIKFRNFINNNKGVSIQLRLKVFQSCFCSAILSNCEIWGQYFPKKVLSLYNKGLKLALEVRTSTPTALIFLETRQPSVLAIVRKRQLKFWLNLRKENGSEMHNLIMRAGKTSYIRHYNKLEEIHKSPDTAFEVINKKFFDDLIQTVLTCKPEQTKLNIYKNIYLISDSIPSTSLSLNSDNEIHQKLLSKYLLSSHNLASETNKWFGNDKNCKQCSQGVSETLNHFLFGCDLYIDIRRKYKEFPSDLRSFFAWDLCGNVLEQLHKQRWE